MKNNGTTHGPEFHVVVVHLMDCAPGNFDRPDGTAATIVTIARGHMIEPLVFSLDDSRRLATKLLVSLATAENQFARKLLDEHFGANADGYFIWPDESGDLPSYQT